MCRTARCRACSKTTWSGCGQHVNVVMASVPSGQRCRCTPEDRRGASAHSDRPSWWQRWRRT